jgi:hypothetical protein
MKVWRWKVGQAKRQWTQLAATLGDGGDTNVLLQGSSVREPLSSFTEGDEQPRSEGWTGTGERIKEFVVGELGAERGDLSIEAFDGGVDRPGAEGWWSRRAAAEER